MRVLDGVDSGSQYQFGDKLQMARFPKSAFDLSHLFTTTVPNAGMVFPVLLKETLPTDSWQVRLNALLRVLPQQVPLYSRQRVYFDAFYVRCSDVWKDWNSYMKKGKSGSLLLERPSLSRKNLSLDGLEVLPEGATPDTATSAKVLPNSIYDYCGIPIGTDLIGLIDDGYHIDALPFMALMQIYRWYYLNKNTYIDDDAMFPDDESDFRLLTDGEILSFKNEGLGSNILGSEMYRLWAQDYFTSALPFAQRGDAPVLPLTMTSGLQLGNLTTSKITAVDGTDIQFGSSGDGIGRAVELGTSSTFKPNTPGTQGKRVDALLGMNIGGNTIDYDLPLKLNDVSFESSSLQFASSVVLDDIRRLAISQLELERMARTDGTYEEFGLTFFGVSSRNAVDYKPLYVGSCYQEVSFSEVLQTSESSSTPLGTYAGHGISVTNDGNIGSFNADDYGYFVVLCSIMPDVYYCQGLDRMFTKSQESEEFLPNRDKMGMRPILNQEIFLSGTKSTDEDLFAYQNPFDEYRYLANEIHGQIADSTKLSFIPYTQARLFTETPNWNKNFVTASDVRKDYLSAPLEDAYTMQVRFDIRAVRPLSYIASPAEVMN